MKRYELNGVTLDIPEELLNDKIAAKLASGKYEGQEAMAVRQRVREGNRVLELGSGLGYIASLCAEITGAENVVTVEANPVMLPVIRANLDRNGYQGATLIHGAVAGVEDASESILFECNQAFWAAKLAVERSNPAKVVEVPVVRMGDLMARYRPHVVIMDIEGAEAQLFEHPWPDHVRAVMMELHPAQYPDTVIKKIVDCMSASGLTYDPGSSRGRVLGFRRVRG